MFYDVRKKIEYLDIFEVCELTGMKKTAIYAKMAAGVFPRNYAVGIRRKMWNKFDVFKWIIEEKKRKNILGAGS